MESGAKAGFAIEKVSRYKNKNWGAFPGVVTAKLKRKGDREVFGAPQNLTYDCDIDDP